MSPEAMSDQKIAILLNALRKCPTYDGITFRGIDADTALGTREGEAVVTKALTATSRDIRIATENSSSAGLFVIAGKTGRSIEKVSANLLEREVVFLPYTLFRVVRRARLGDLPVVIVEQLDPAHPPAAPAAERELEPWQEWLRTAAQAHMAALKMPKVAITSPGKFVGTID